MDGDKVYIFPRLGLVVRDPSSFTPLAESGETKTIIGPDGRYWRRRIKDGDVVVMDPPAPVVEDKSGGKK